MNISPAVRHGSALVGIAGALLLSGCTAEASSAETPVPSGTGSAQNSGASSAPSSSTSGTYKDGEYKADGSYQTPETVEKISVALTLDKGTVTAVTVTGDPQAPETKNYQGQFIKGISSVVVGKKLDDISVDKVAGSSLTSKGFNQALDKIRTQAKG